MVSVGTTGSMTATRGAFTTGSILTTGGAFWATTGAGSTLVAGCGRAIGAVARAALDWTISSHEFQMLRPMGTFFPLYVMATPAESRRAPSSSTDSRSMFWVLQALITPFIPSAAAGEAKSAKLMTNAIRVRK